MSKTRVLVVDDEKRFTRIIRIILEGLGTYQVMIVSQATRAIKVALQFQPHVMLLNVDMPDKEHSDMACAAATNARLRDIPIIFLTPRVYGRRFNTSRRLNTERTILRSPVAEEMKKLLFDFSPNENLVQAAQGGSVR